jgi:hypothetical protein
MIWAKSEILTCINHPHCPKQFRVKDVQEMSVRVFNADLPTNLAFPHIYRLVEEGILIKVSRGLFTLSIYDGSLTPKSRIEELKTLQAEAENTKLTYEDLEVKLAIAKQLKLQAEVAFHQAYQELVEDRMFQVNQELGNIETLILPTTK